MTLYDLLPALNLLLLPAMGLLIKISGQLATLEAVRHAHDQRITRLENSTFFAERHSP